MSRLKEVNESYSEVTKMMVNSFGPNGELLEVQKISVLHQISQTLAMLYDKYTEWNKNNEVGKWIEHPHEAGPNWEYSMYECSKCHGWVEDDSDYCPDCGAKMESEDNNGRIS